MTVVGHYIWCRHWYCRYMTWILYRINNDIEVAMVMILDLW